MKCREKKEGHTRDEVLVGYEVTCVSCGVIWGVERKGRRVLIMNVRCDDGGGGGSKIMVR